MPIFMVFLALATGSTETVAILLDKTSIDDPSVEPVVVVEPNPSVAAHEHAVFVELGETSPRRVRVSIELDGAMRAVPAKRRFAAAVLVIASALVKGPVGPAVAPFVSMAARQIVTPAQRVVVFAGSSLKHLGDGTYLLKFRCLHDNPINPRIRVTVRAKREKKDEPWEIMTPWRPLASPSFMAEHSEE